VILNNSAIVTEADKQFSQLSKAKHYTRTILIVGNSLEMQTLSNIHSLSLLSNRKTQSYDKEITETDEYK
jgi:hypothetical protein